MKTLKKINEDYINNNINIKEARRSFKELSVNNIPLIKRRAVESIAILDLNEYLRIKKRTSRYMEVD